NLVFVRDLLRRAHGATVRLMLAAHHYRESWQYEDEELAIAETRRVAFGRAMGAGSAVDADEARALRREFLQRIDDDLDTAGALRVIDLAATALAHSRLAAGADTIAGETLLGGMLDVIGARVTSPVA
ncbi:MAG: hypothetical protein ABR498_04685, partial [Candidatus Dormibacteria bacterium]